MPTDTMNTIHPPRRPEVRLGVPLDAEGVPPEVRAAHETYATARQAYLDGRDEAQAAVNAVRQFDIDARDAVRHDLDGPEPGHRDVLEQKAHRVNLRAVRLSQAATQAARAVELAHRDHAPTMRALNARAAIDADAELRDAWATVREAFVRRSALASGHGNAWMQRGYLAGGVHADGHQTVPGAFRDVDNAVAAFDADAVRAIANGEDDA
jgi:hypothetical protein